MWRSGDVEVEVEVEVKVGTLQKERRGLSNLEQRDTHSVRWHHTLLAPYSAGIIPRYHISLTVHSPHKSKRAHACPHHHELQTPLLLKTNHSPLTTARPVHTQASQTAHKSLTPHSSRKNHALAITPKPTPSPSLTNLSLRLKTR